MYQNYNYYNPNQHMMPQSNYMRSQMGMNNNQMNVLKGHPVSSLDEAKAASIDFDGSVFFFPDPANKCIYTKQINADGTATLSVYEYKNMPNPAQNNSQYITREEFEYALAQLRGGGMPDAQPSNSAEIKF